MNKLSLLLSSCLVASCAFADNVESIVSQQIGNPINVVSFKGVQITGVTLAKDGRMFANAPKWRESVPYSVIEIMADKSIVPYPNESMNSWKLGDTISDKFISVQSVVADGGYLYVLDTANPMFKGIITEPRLYVYDLATNKLVKTYVMPSDVVKTNSYTNDLRVDHKLNKIYITDSGAAGLIIIDTKTDKFTRVLNNSPYTSAELDYLTIYGKKWNNKVHADGIALDRKHDILYIHALSGYSLYGIKTADLNNPQKLKNIKPFEIKTSAPDGMIMDDKGNLYFGDLENNKISYLTHNKKNIKVLVNGDHVKWPDTFSIYDGYLYFSNSRISEATGDISDMVFEINKVKLPN